MIRPVHDANGRARWGVTRCDCGVFRVKLGGLLLELDQDEFLQLVRLMNRAAEHFGVESPPVERQGEALTH